MEEIKKGYRLLHYVGHGHATAIGERWMLTADRWLQPDWRHRSVAGATGFPERL
jgi:hypothetical protein